MEWVNDPKVMEASDKLEPGRVFGHTKGKFTLELPKNVFVYPVLSEARYKELNRLKERVKLEVDSRKHADEEIAVALEKYQELISKEVETKRQDIKGTKPFSHD
jgi:hypothetical protein